MNSKVKVGLVIMASGYGRRYGGNKLMVLLKGKPLIQWAMDTTEDMFDRRIVVTRYENVKKLCVQRNIDYILHDFSGQNDTIRLGLSELMEDVDVCFFLPGDQPLIKKETILRLIESSKENPDRIIRSCNGDTVGSPVGFPKQTYEELLTLPEGSGGSKVLRKHPELVKLISVEAEWELWDVDTKEDFGRIEKIMKL